MAHHNTVFGQLLTLLPRHEFDAEARDHQRGQRLRVMSRWAQFVALGLGQLASRQSLRDIVSNLRAQPAKLYHLGVPTVSRSSLARVNAEQPYTLYEALFGRLLSRCQQRAPGHRFRFRHKLYAVDASTIDLCLAVFPWASFRRTKAAIKLHIGLDQAGHLPSFLSVTDGKTADVTVARTWTFEAGSVVVADRAYLDFTWFHQLQARGVTFVTRLKRGVRYRVTREHEVRAGTGILSDQTIELTSARSRKVYPDRLRRVVYRDPLTRNRCVFVTNNTTWVAKTIADLYKSRWQIELFFKWIKQHLKVKRFVGRSKNAVLTQLWVATCMYLLLAYLKFVLRLRWSLNQMLHTHKKPLRVRDQQHHVGRQDDRRPVQVPVADRAVFQVDQAASEGETFRGPVEKRGLDATVGGHLHVPAAGLPQVRPAAALEPQPDAAGAAAQHLRTPASRRPLHHPFATRPRPAATRAGLGLRLWDTSLHYS